jgi:hypothetical protein
MYSMRETGWRFLYKAADSVYHRWVFPKHTSHVPEPYAT